MNKHREGFYNSGVIWINGQSRRFLTYSRSFGPNMNVLNNNDISKDFYRKSRESTTRRLPFWRRRNQQQVSMPYDMHPIVYRWEEARWIRAKSNIFSPREQYLLSFSVSILDSVHGDRVTYKKKKKKNKHSSISNKILVLFCYSCLI